MSQGLFAPGVRTQRARQHPVGPAPEIQPILQTKICNIPANPVGLTFSEQLISKQKPNRGMGTGRLLAMKKR